LGYAPPLHDVAYPSGFADNGVTITGSDLAGIGAGHGIPEHLTADGSMTLSFAPTNAFAFYLWPPGSWRITLPLWGTFVTGSLNSRAWFQGLGLSVPFDSITVTSYQYSGDTCFPSGGPVNLLTTPPRGVPEPASWGALAMGLLGLGAAYRRLPIPK
jgi:hypothetical protein